MDSLNVAIICPKMVDRFWSRVCKYKEEEACWIWLAAKTTAGYGELRISKNKALYAHRMSWELAYGPIPEGMDVLHRCDNPSCVRPDHLFLGTDKDNHRDMAEKNRSTWGELNPASKLTWEQVRQIRSKYRKGNAMQLAKEYGVRRNHIYGILKNRYWKERGEPT